MHMQRYFAIRNGTFFLFGFTGYLCSYLQDFSCVNILSFQSPKLYVDKKKSKITVLRSMGFYNKTCFEIEIYAVYEISSVI